MPPDLSAIVLCYRAGDEIVAVLEPLHRQVAASGHSFEVLAVANYWPGQEDRTPDVVKEFAASHDNVRVISEPKQGAMGWDLRSGLSASRGDIIVSIDGDSQNPTEDVVRMFQLMRDTGADVMKGL